MDLYYKAIVCVIFWRKVKKFFFAFLYRLIVWVIFWRKLKKNCVSVWTYKAIVWVIFLEKLKKKISFLYGLIL
jgi:hypothetical protein